MTSGTFACKLKVDCFLSYFPETDRKEQVRSWLWECYQDMDSILQKAADNSKCSVFFYLTSDIKFYCVIGIDRIDLTSSKLEMHFDSNLLNLASSCFCNHLRQLGLLVRNPVSITEEKIEFMASW